MSADRDAILAGLRQALPDLKERWPIRSLGVFGSFARGDVTDASDLDVLVEFERPVDMFSFLALEEALAALSGKRVDLVTRRALKPFIGRNILRDLVPL